MRKYTIHIGDNPITLEHEDLDNVLNVDDLTKINVSNIFGEAVTASALSNRVGLIRADCQEAMDEAKLRLKIYEANYRAEKRLEASQNSQYFYIRGEDGVSIKTKYSEKAMETAHENEPEWIEKKEAFIQAERDFNRISALYWAIQNKCRTVSSLVGGTTPEEFVKELVEGKVNGILIKKGY